MDFNKMSKFLDSIPHFGAPGVDCLVQKDGKTVYRHMAGYSDRESETPMSGKELFYLYSATKVITCTAAMQLYEKGKFILSDPLESYIPEFSGMQVKRNWVNGEFRLSAAERPITIGDLFSMTAGLDYDLQSPAIVKALEAKNGKATTQDIVRALAKQPLAYEPGTHWRYSLAHDVLGALIEVLSGMRFGEYLSKYIFEPLGMENTGFDCSDEIQARMMVQYRRDNVTGEVVRIPFENEYIICPSYESGGAGLISSVEDYSKFASMLANGGTGSNGAHILSPATIELMRTNRLNAQQMKDFDWIQFVGYGYGLGVRTLVDKAAAGSTGPVGEFGWGGAAGCYLLVDPDRHINMFYAQQMRESMEAYVHPRLRNILYTCL